MRGEDHSARQLKDDLMTFLIAGHETTAAVLTWALYLLSSHPEWMQRLTQEIDTILQDESPSMETLYRMVNLRLVLAEALRLYPQPPLLIRRSINADVIPGGKDGPPEGFPIGPGADLFISSWNLHRSPHLWQDPDSFNPDRFREPFTNPEFNGDWAGYKPNLTGVSFYPNEATSDFAFIPFGGGGRKCIGDQFAFLESCVCLAMLLRRFKYNPRSFHSCIIPVCFSFELVDEDSVSMVSGATIHTKSGLVMRLTRRQPPPSLQDTSPDALVSTATP